MDRKRRLLFGNNVGARAAASASFSATLLSTLVPQVYTGSSTPTFTRATTAYVTDFEVLLKKCLSGESRFAGARRVQNIVPNSEVSTGWSLNTITATAGQTDPLGGTTAFRLTATAASNNVMYATVSAPSGATTGSVTWSIWAKRVTGSGTVRLAMNSGAQGNATLSLTTSWQRFSVSNAAAISGGSVQLNVYVDTNADAIDVAFMLAEETTGQSNTNPSEYVSKGVLSAPYHGAGVDGVKYFTTQNGNTVASNVVTEATGAAISSATLLGYLAEGARTNLCLQSQTFGTTWSVTSTTITADSIAAPDGTTTADTVNITAGTTAKYILQGGLTVTNPNTFSVYAKAGTHALVQLAENISANRYVNFDLANGVVGSNGAGVTRSSIASVGNGWYRLEAVFNNADATSVIVGVISATTDTWAPGLSISTTGTFYLWGAQVENAAFASSYIPTTTVAVTRNADALSYVFANNASATAGTVYVEPRIPAIGVTSSPFNSGSGQGMLLPNGQAQFFDCLLYTSDAADE